MRCGATPFRHLATISASVASPQTSRCRPRSQTSPSMLTGCSGRREAPATCSLTKYSRRESHLIAYDYVKLRSTSDPTDSRTRKAPVSPLSPVSPLPCKSLLAEMRFSENFSGRVVTLVTLVTGPAAWRPLGSRFNHGHDAAKSGLA